MSPGLHLVHPGPADAATGGSRYNLKLSSALRARGRDVALHRVDGGWPHPAAGEQARYAAVLASIKDASTVLVDGLVYSAAPEVAASQAGRLRLVPVLHLPLAEETGLRPDAAQRLQDLERAALAHAFRVLATSAFTARVLEALGVSPGRTWVVEPGVDPAPEAAAGEGTRLLCVAAVTPRKGQDVLVEALGLLAAREWQCRLVGPLGHASGFVDELRQRIEALGLSSRIGLPGPCAGAELESAYQCSDLLVLPSRFETYGMVLTEALARGLPIVSTRAGAIPETAPSDAALLVAPGDARALAGALSRWLDDAGLRERLRLGARRHRVLLQDWSRQAGRLDALLHEVGS